MSIMVRNMVKWKNKLIKMYYVKLLFNYRYLLEPIEQVYQPQKTNFKLF